MELMKLNGSKMLSNTWKQELIVTDTGVEAEILIVGRRTKKTLPYERIAQVNLSNGILTTDIEVVNTGGADNVVVRAVNKKEAVKAKELIEQKMLEISTKRNGTTVADDIPAQIKKLSDLKQQGILTEVEFNSKKSELLAKM